MKLIKFKNLCKESLLVFNDLKKWSILINLDHSWSLEKSLDIEIKKSILRSQIRYSINTDNLLFKILKSISSVTKNNCKFTRLYPMIHLPNDKIEAGGFHFDQVDNKEIKTVWIAASNYNYPALSIFDLNLKNKKIKSALIKLKVPNIFGKKIYSEQGDINIWDGSLIHAGNFNNSKNVSLALQMKLIDHKDNFIFEDTKDVLNVGPNCFIEKNYVAKDVCQLYEEFNYLIEQILLRSEENSKVSYDLSILNDFSSKFNFANFAHYSFAMSILSQRIRSFKNLFSSKIKNLSKFTILLDYMSLILGAENLVSAKRLFIDYDRNKDFLDLIKNYIDNSDNKFEKFNKIIEIF
tara:strand:- start:399 stop:1451 length:1053 start_codon:yes stop_codon:yes gene_type:complete